MCNSDEFRIVISKNTEKQEDLCKKLNVSKVTFQLHAIKYVVRLAMTNPGLQILPLPYYTGSTVNSLKNAELKNIYFAYNYYFFILARNC